MFNILDQSILR